MEKFELHILGCGSAKPTTRHNSTSQVLDVRDKLFMIDCAEGTQLQMGRQHLSFSRLNHIFISHLHGDHCFGLPGLISTFGLLGRTAKLHIYSPGTELERLLSPWLDFFCPNLGYEVVFHALDPKERGVIYADRSLSVETIPLKHRIPCCGYLFREVAPLPHIRRDMMDFLGIPYHAVKSVKEGGDWIDAEGRVWPHERLVIPREEHGRSYAYCSDTLYLPANVEQLKGVDVLFHEATFADDAAPRARSTGHSTARQAGKIARAAEVGRLIIGHFSARYEDESILLNEAIEEFPHTLLAREGLVVRL